MQRVKIRSLAASTLLLDLDGTVWDSRPWYATAIARLSGVGASEIESKLGEGANVIRLARSHGVSKAKFAREAVKNVDRPALYDGVMDTLNRLRDLAIPLGIVSNLSGSLVEPLLNSTGLERYFDSVVFPGRGVSAKPQPHGIRKALRELGQEGNTSAWYLGDGAVDAKAAQAAGVRFAWVSYGYDDEVPLGADEVIDQFEDVLKLVC